MIICMQLSFSEFSAFQVALYYSFVQFLSEFIKEIGAAVILATFYIHIDVVAVLDFYSEDFREDVCQFFYTDFTIIDAVAGIKCVK